MSTRPPRSLEELLEREEALATRGLQQTAQALGRDACELVLVSRHAERFLVTATALGGLLGFVLGRRARRVRAASADGRVAPLLARLLLRSAAPALASAVLARFARALGTRSG